MRSDMAKVIVERPRHGSRNRSRKGYKRRWQRTAAEDAPRRERITALRGGTRMLNEHLGPLRRYLAKQVGRPWDKVFAEICQHIRLDSAVQSHVRDHVDDYVETHALIINGQACSSDGWNFGRPLWRNLWKRFYVCPRTGLLRNIKRVRARNATTPRAGIPIDANHQYYRINDIWYEVALRPLADAPAACLDVVLGVRANELTYQEARKTYGAAVFAASKRQLNKREIRRLPSKAV